MENESRSIHIAVQEDKEAAIIAKHVDRSLLKSMQGAFSKRVAETRKDVRSIEKCIAKRRPLPRNLVPKVRRSLELLRSKMKQTDRIRESISRGLIRIRIEDGSKRSSSGGIDSAGAADGVDRIDNQENTLGTTNSSVSAARKHILIDKLTKVNNQLQALHVSKQMMRAEAEASKHATELGKVEATTRVIVSSSPPPPPARTPSTSTGGNDDKAQRREKKETSTTQKDLRVLGPSVLPSVASAFNKNTRNATNYGVHVHSVSCGCVPPVPSLFEMARLRKERRAKLELEAREKRTREKEARGGAPE